MMPSLPRQNDSIDFWGSGEGISLRLGLLSGSINTGSYNNTLQVLAPAYGVQYFKMSGPQPKCEYCTRYYGHIYRQGMFMPEFPTHPFCPHLWEVWFPRAESGWLLKQGYSKATITGRLKLLNRLMRLGADFNNEDSIKEIISKQTWSVSRKVNAVDAYDSLLKMQQKIWTPPIYRRVRKLPFIPTEAEIDQLIAGCSRKIATFLQLLKETGMRCGEACELLKWTDIDLEQRSIRITPEKGSNPRILPLSVKLVDMLTEIPKNTSTVFSPSADLIRHNFEHQRKRVSAKLKNSRIKQITFHTFRHWKATMEYRKTRDILHVKEILGHKSLNNTMLYTQLISFKDDDFSATVAHSEEEACKLIEAGFEYVCDFGQNKIFSKRK